MTDCPQCHLVMDEFRGRFLCDKCGQVYQTRIVTREEVVWVGPAKPTIIDAKPEEKS